MSSSTFFYIVIALFVAAILFWLIRSRGNTTGEHIDTSMTAVGAVTEAVEDLVETITHKAEDVLRADAAATGSKETDTAALESASAALAASAGGLAMVPIGIPAAQGEPDNLRQLKGVGPKLASLLTELGVTRFDQIAAWGPAEVETVDTHLGTFKGRITRDNWIEQAAFLAKGDTAGFEARFGKLDG